MFLHTYYNENSEKLYQLNSLLTVYIINTNFYKFNIIYFISIYINKNIGRSDIIEPHITYFRFALKYMYDFM